MISRTIRNFLKAEALPKSYERALEAYFIPLAEDLKKRCLKRKPLRVGIQGAQGTGKSTLAKLLVLLLEENHNIKTAQLSLDDFYLTREARLNLAREVHPLLETRGVPGTHDLVLAAKTLDALCTSDAETTVAVPQFDKAMDDRVPFEEWPLVKRPLDVIILEGWCLAAQPEDHLHLSDAINDLEETEDPKCIWRRYVNEQFKTGYSELFERIDLLIVLQAPSFKAVYTWRALQEKKLAERRDGKNHHIMNEVKLKRFVQHFERITRHCLSILPNKADIVLKLNAQHEVIRAVYQSTAGSKISKA